MCQCIAQVTHHSQQSLLKNKLITLIRDNNKKFQSVIILTTTPYKRGLNNAKDGKVFKEAGTISENTVQN
jgi:hypothetical protein